MSSTLAPPRASTAQASAREKPSRLGAREGLEEERIERSGLPIGIVLARERGLERAYASAEHLRGRRRAARDLAERHGRERREPPELEAHARGAHEAALLDADRHEALCVEVRGADRAPRAADHGARVGRAEVEDQIALAETLPPGLVPSVRRSDGGTDGPISGKRSGPIATAPTVAASTARTAPASRAPWLALGGIGAIAAIGAIGWLVLAPAGDASSATSTVHGAAIASDAATAPDASEITDAGLDAFEIVDAASEATNADDALGPEAIDPGAPDPSTIDPWSRGVPLQLRRYVERTTSRALARRERTAIARWIRTHQEDCRGPLAYGHALMSQGARTEALEHYREALALEPIARNDPRLRTNLLRIAAYDGNPREGAELAAETYGETLLPDIDAFLSTLDPADPDGRRAAQRLRALRSRVAR